jgi:hypothetical protein
MTAAPTAPTPPRSNRPAPPPPPPMAGGAPAPSSPATRKPLSFAPRQVKPICPAMVINAVEKWGKTTTAAYAPNPIILMARGETGYDTLLSAGLVPAVPAELVESYDRLLEVLDTLIEAPGDRKTVVLDAIGGFERLTHEHCCYRDFGNDWTDRGFASFQKGYDISVTYWLAVLQRLEKLKNAGLVVVMLGHIKTKMHNNPMGANFDRYISDVHEKTWAATAKWADCILFGNFLTIVDAKKGAKAKGIAGNRYGMDAEIYLPSDDHTAAWPTIWKQIVGEPE